MTFKEFLRKIVNETMLDMSVPLPMCECEDGGLPDEKYNMRMYCGCFRCGWYISRKRVCEMECNKKGEQG